MEGLFEVFFSGREFKSATPKGGGGGGSPGTVGAGVEAFEENRINSQVMGYMQSDDGMKVPATLELGNLPSGGMYDELLSPGRSGDLFKSLPKVFMHDPPVNCGANPALLGLSCAYGDSYGARAFSAAAIATCLSRASKCWDETGIGNVQRLTIPQGSRLIVVGDIHGQLEDVLWMFYKYGPPSSQNRYLFNGDLVDRGGHSLEVLVLLFCYMRDDPESVYLQRGNHEDVQCSIHFGFKTELQSKFGADVGGTLWNLCGAAVFPYMPIATTVCGPLTGGRYFCVLHGGIPIECPGQSKPISLEDDICRIDRRVSTVQATKDFHSHVMFNLLWSDPCDGSESKRDRNHGRGNRFLEQDTKDFCEANGMAFVVRSHEVPRSLRGATASHGGKCFTVFSASNYMGSTGNRGGVFVAEVGKGLQLREHFAPPWKTLHQKFQPFPESAAERATSVDEWEREYNIGNVEDASQTPRATTGIPPVARPNFEAQQRQFVMERICEHKDKLFANFRAVDSHSTGFVSKSQWANIMLDELGPVCPEVLTLSLLERLAEVWGLDEKVGYVRFLHRFQIRGPDERSSAPDLMREVSNLRRKLLDVPTHHFEHLLDPNGDRTVSSDEFMAFLPQLSIDLPPCQARALYETMAQFAQQDPLTLDNTILCLSIMSRDPIPRNSWSDIAEQVGNEILRHGISYAHAFRLWDKDRDGYLGLSEVREGLTQFFPSKSQLDEKTTLSFMKFIECTGVENQRISMLEFVRAVAPRKLSIELHQNMLKEILKRVWICRPALQHLLAHFDPCAKNRVTVAEFRLCLAEVNHQLEQRGRPLLSDLQIASICEIASGGCNSVDYDRFISGLHVVDMGASN